MHLCAASCCEDSLASTEEVHRSAITTTDFNTTTIIITNAW